MDFNYERDGVPFVLIDNNRNVNLYNTKGEKIDLPVIKCSLHASIDNINTAVIEIPAALITDEAQIQEHIDWQKRLWQEIHG